MTIGEQAILVIDAEYGYGNRGAGGVIPGGATLYFNVELMGASEDEAVPAAAAHDHDHDHDHAGHDHSHEEHL